MKIKLGLKAAATAFEEVYETPVLFSMEGGSIPIVADFKRVLGVESILMGFGVTSDAIHSPNESEFLGDVGGCDVIIIDEVVETANSLSTLCHELKKRGAKKIYFSASHGLFTKESMSLIDLSPVEKVVVTDTVDLSTTYCSSEKIMQVSIAKLIAHVIDTDYFVARKDEAETLEVE